MYNINEIYDYTCKMVIGEITQTLEAINPNDVDYLIENILAARKVFFVGVGRVELSLKAIAKRWAHLGISTHIVGEITEPAITKDDILIVGSGSGNSIIPFNIAVKAKEIGAKIIHIGSNKNGKVRDYTDYIVRIPVRTKLYLDDEIDSQQIMTSLFEQVLLIFGDIIAKIIVEKKEIDLKQLWQYHANLE